MSCGTAWVVTDDDQLERELGIALQNCDCELIRKAATRSCGVNGNNGTPQWIFVDVRNPHGWEVAHAIHSSRVERPAKPVAMIGLLDEGYPLDECLNASQVFDDWTTQPFCCERLSQLTGQLPTGNLAKRSHTINQPRVLQTETHRFETHTPALCEMIEHLELAASRDFTILLVGETGTGKTTLARILHDLSHRGGKPFLNVGCGALPNELIDSELFGHVKGSFTSADSTTEGKFAAAKDGTILLDEIDVLAVAQQVKLLRVLESGEYEQIGSNKISRVNARVIVATNVELELLIQKKQFRQDLYFRLNQVKFEIPPLRNRPADIAPLTLHFVEDCCRAHNLNIRRIHPDFLSALKTYSWPGNIRELRNEVSRAVLFAKNGVLTRKDLSPMIIACGSDTADDLCTPVGLAAEVASTEQAAIEKMLQVHNYNRAATARALGISRVTLYNKLRKYRIRVESLQQQRGST